MENVHSRKVGAENKVTAPNAKPKNRPLPNALNVGFVSDVYAGLVLFKSDSSASSEGISCGTEPVSPIAFTEVWEITDLFCIDNFIYFSN
jgi:hypothetical protein